MQTFIQGLTDALTCPVCRSPTIKTRMMTCGHHLCDKCSQDVDRDTERNRHRRQLAIDASLYKCPVCRNESILKHQERTRCYTIDTIVELLRLESEPFDAECRQCETLNESSPAVDAAPRPSGFLHFDQMIENERNRVCDLVFGLIMDRMYENAAQGHCIVIIRDEHVYNAFLIAGNKLSKMLFERSSLYSVSIANRQDREIIFYLTRDAHTTSTDRLFVNTIDMDSHMTNPSPSASATSTEDEPQ